MERNITNSHPPPSLIGPFPRHEGRAALKALIMETTPVSICPYLSAFVVAVPGRGLSHTKPTECLSVCLLLWPPCGSTYLNPSPYYLAVTTFLQHAHTNALAQEQCVAHGSVEKHCWHFCTDAFVLCGFAAFNISGIYKTFTGSNTFQHKC